MFLIQAYKQHFTHNAQLYLGSKSALWSHHWLSPSIRMIKETTSSVTTLVTCILQNQQNVVSVVLTRLEYSFPCYTHCTLPTQFMFCSLQPTTTKKPTDVHNSPVVTSLQPAVDNRRRSAPHLKKVSWEHTWSCICLPPRHTAHPQDRRDVHRTWISQRRELGSWHRHEACVLFWVHLSTLELINQRTKHLCQFDVTKS